MAASIYREQVIIPDDHIGMKGLLWLPDNHMGIILIVNGHPKQRGISPNDYVARVLRDVRLATLWFDVGAGIASDGQERACIDITLLARRINLACDWLQQYAATCDLPLGLYGVSHAAAAVLQVATLRAGICAIVSRGCRTDLNTPDTFGKISAPTLLIVGGLDDGMIEANRAAYAALRCKKQFEIIPGATHTFEEPGSLEVAGRLARGWFLQHSQAAYNR